MSKISNSIEKILEIKLKEFEKKINEIAEQAISKVITVFEGKKTQTEESPLGENVAENQILTKINNLLENRLGQIENIFRGSVESVLGPQFKNN